MGDHVETVAGTTKYRVWGLEDLATDIEAAADGVWWLAVDRVNRANTALERWRGPHAMRFVDEANAVRARLVGFRWALRGQANRCRAFPDSPPEGLFDSWRQQDELMALPVEVEDHDPEEEVGWDAPSLAGFVDAAGEDWRLAGYADEVDLDSLRAEAAEQLTQSEMEEAGFPDSDLGAVDVWREEAFEPVPVTEVFELEDLTGIAEDVKAQSEALAVWTKAVLGAYEAADEPALAFLLERPEMAWALDNDPRTQDLVGWDLDDFAGEQGGRIQQMYDDALQALEDGDYEEADRLLKVLENYQSLSEGGRGELVTDLASITDDEFADLVDQGTIYQDGGHNRRYFEVEAAPGDGLLVFDFFIRQHVSGYQPAQLYGDDRGPSDPLLSDLGIDDSRFMVLLDRESGRGMIVQAESEWSGPGDTVVGTNEPRPIALDTGMDDVFSNDSDNDALFGEGVNLDISNQFDVGVDGGSVSLTYDALNSITPLGSVDGTVTIERQDGGQYELTENDRDDYPAVNLYQYRPGSQPHQIAYDAGGEWHEAIPRVDLPDGPDLPATPWFDLPDTPDLPTIPLPFSL